jgi:uncharacterized protein YndB with AHSA1/START domain
MTTMTETNLAVQVYQVFIKATPEQVWDAMTNADFTEKYFYGSRVTFDQKAGGAFVGRGAESGNVMADGEVLEYDRPRRLQHTWRSLYDESAADEPASRVTWELESDGGVTKLTVVHDRLENAPQTAASVAGGWSYVLSGLKTLLETGQPLTA